MQADAEIRNSRYYQSLIKSATDYVIGINRNFQVIMANDLFKSAFGNRLGDYCYRVWKNRRTQCSDCLVDQTFRDGREHWNIEDIRMADGQPVQMLVKSTPVVDDQGRVIYVLETATDISGRKQLEENLHRVAGKFDKILADHLQHLRKAKDRYQAIFERSRDAILLTDPRGCILEINQVGVSMLGYRSTDEVTALPSVDLLFANKDFNHLQKQVSQEGYVTEFETRLVRRSNNGFYAQITANVTVDDSGKINGYVFIIRDITKWKQARHQIETRNARLATLNAIATTVSKTLKIDEILRHTIDKILDVLECDSVRIYLLQSDHKTLQLAAHRGHSELFTGKDHMKRRQVGDGLLGQTAINGAPKVVDNFLRSEDPYVDSLIEEGLHSTIYIPLLAKGTTKGVMCVSCHHAFKFSDDYVDFLTAIGSQIGVAIDNANLYANIEGAYEELKKAQEQIIRSEKLASLGKLAATIAHEINNPLAVVLTYVRLMIKLLTRKRFTPEKAEDIARYLNTMESETSRCGEIVKNLLAFSRQSKIVIEYHDIADIFERTLILIAHDLQIKEIRLIKAIDPDLPKVQCDFKQMQQALLNLMSNASEAMSRGGTLTVSAACTGGSPRVVEVAISDTGCGIPTEDLKNIFEPFFTTKEEGKGVGLGLSVAYGIIARHNGAVDVQSEPGRGTVFKVSLPVASDDGRRKPDQPIEGPRQ